MVDRVNTGNLSSWTCESVALGFWQVFCELFLLVRSIRSNPGSNPGRSIFLQGGSIMDGGDKDVVFRIVEIDGELYEYVPGLGLVLL